MKTIAFTPDFPTGEQLRDAVRDVVLAEMTTVIRGAYVEVGTLGMDIQYDDEERDLHTVTPTTYFASERLTLREAATGLANEWCRLVGVQLGFTIQEEKEITDVL